MVEEDGERVWRASLEVIRSGERYGFATLENLLDFLREQTQQKDARSTAEKKAAGG
jgi:hypothetical protein